MLTHRHQKQGFYPAAPSVAVGKGRQFTLAQDLLYVSNKFPNVLVPAGFETDFASVPKVLWSLIGPIGRQSLPAIVHDYLYVLGEGKKEDADNLFYEALRQQGMSRWKAYLMYVGVKLGGKGNY